MTAGIEPGCPLPSGADYYRWLSETRLATELMKCLAADVSTRLGDARDRLFTSSYRKTQYLMLHGGVHTMITENKKSIIDYAIVNGME